MNNNHISQCNDPTQLTICNDVQSVLNFTTGTDLPPATNTNTSCKPLVVRFAAAALITYWRSAGLFLKRRHAILL